MVICQTLWTNKKNILEDSFGWLTPQHHLMSWALSTLKLAKHYKDLHLYTDSGGKEMLIDQLGLPYTTVFNEYDNLDCRPYLWAFPKLLTYGRQDQPFLHIDGDVFVWHPFEKELLSSGLIAQNLEKATEIYSKSLPPFARRLQYLPGFLKRNLLSHNMRAYNAGILGGHDIDFFKRYVATASELIARNDTTKLDSNFNIIFEQLLFFSMVEKEKKTVNPFIDRLIDDYGYNHRDFADFPNVDHLKYLHVIGKHKLNKEICDWLTRYLRHENEEVFLRIVSLFKKRHYFYNNSLKEVYPIAEPVSTNKFNYSKSEYFIQSLNPGNELNTNAKLGNYIENSNNVLLKELYKYEQRVNRICAKFRKIDFSHLKQIEEGSMLSIRFLNMKDEDKMQVKLYSNPYIEIIHSAFDWTTIKFYPDGNLDIKCSDKNNIVISIIPELFFSGYRELVLDESCVNIIVLAEEGLLYKDLLVRMSALFPPVTNEKEYEAFCELIFLKVGDLIKNKMLLIQA